MAKLAAKKKPTKPDAPKKPTSRSKTGNAECSQAASNWQLSIRGKATLNPGTYQTLAKCRALSSTKKKADAYGRTGKLSDMGAAALAGRAEKRFAQGLVTQKSRTDRLNMLLKQRSARGKLSSANNRREARAAQTGMTPEQRSKEAKRISATLNNRREAGSGTHSVATGMGFKSVSDKSVFDEAIRAQRANRQTRILTQKGKSGNLAAHSTETRDSLTKMTNSEFDRLPSDMQKRASQNNSSRTPYVNTTVYTRAVEIELEKTGKIPHGFLDTPIGGITHRERINRRLHMGMTPEDAAGDLKPFLEAAGKKGTSIPAKITSQMILQQQSTTTPPKPAEPARYSLGGKLAPGRGTEERKALAAVKAEGRKLINATTAKVGSSAFAFTSYSPEQRAKRLSQELTGSVQSNMRNQLKRVTTASDAKVVLGVLQRHSGQVQSKATDYTRSQSRVASSAITGPARFNVRANEKRGDVADKRFGEMTDYVGGLENAVSRELLKKSDVGSQINRLATARTRLESRKNKLNSAKSDQQRIGTYASYGVDQFKDKPKEERIAALKSASAEVAKIDKARKIVLGRIKKISAREDLLKRQTGIRAAKISR